MSVEAPGWPEKFKIVDLTKVGKFFTHLALEALHMPLPDHLIGRSDHDRGAEAMLYAEQSEISGLQPNL